MHSILITFQNYNFFCVSFVVLMNFRIAGRHRLTDVDKKHKCTFCPMKFFKKDKLTRHIRTHTGEKRK